MTRKITSGVARIKAGLQDTIELGNLNAYRDWGYAEDYVEAMWLMLQEDKPGDYVIATGEMHSVGEFAALACELADLPKDWYEYITINPLCYRPNDVAELRGDATLAREKLGWYPRTNFETLVACMVQADLRRVEYGSKRIVASVR